MHGCFSIVGRHVPGLPSPKSMPMETKIVFPKNVAMVLFEDDLDHFMILAKNENIINPIDIHQLVLLGMQSTFPKVETILNIYFTIPISRPTASRKQSFSLL